MRPEAGLLTDAAPASARLWSLRRIVTVVPVAVGILLCATVAAIIILNARIAIDQETASAFRTARATVAARMPPGVADSDTPGGAMRLARDIDGLRHVSAFVIDAEGVPLTAGAGGATPDPAPAPGWFIRLMRPGIRADDVPISHDPGIAGSLVIQTDPADEIAEVWDDFRIIMPLLALTCIALAGFSVGFSGLILRRLKGVQDALGAIRQGDLDRRAAPGRLAEIATLAEGVNALADHLARRQAENDLLQTRLLTLSESERARIASDLHDEMGPQIFAMNAALSQAMAGARDVPGPAGAQLDDALRAVATHAGAVRDSARAAINDLRPMLTGHGSLPELIGELIAEFAEIAPDVSITMTCHGTIAADETAKTAIYRFVRESVLNAIRHGRARRITIGIGAAQGRIVAQVRDDGIGPPARAPVRQGHGLAGIRDRARALGASFDPPRRDGAETVTELRMPER